MTRESTLSLPDGGMLHYEVFGDGPPLLLVSGLGGLGRFWNPHLDALARHFSVVIHDHRGTGRSSRDAITYSIEQMTDDVVALADALGLDRVHFVGHSTGGAIGQQLVLEHPRRVQRLVLSSTWASPDPYMKALFELRAEILRSSGMDTYARLGELLTYPPDWIRDHGASARAGTAGRLDARITLSRIAALLRFDRHQDLGTIRAPTLVIGARDDMVVPAHCSDALAALIPGTRRVVEPHGGHFLPVTRPQSYREHLLGFLLDTRS